MGEKLFCGMILLACISPFPASAIPPFYQVGDTWKYDYVNRVGQGQTVTEYLGWTRIEITKLDSIGDTIRYAYRMVDSGIIRTVTMQIDTVERPFLEEGQGEFGFTQGNYFHISHHSVSTHLQYSYFFARNLSGLNAFKVRYGSDTLVYLKQDDNNTWDVNEYLESWGPVRFQFASAGGHTNIWVERNLLEHNGASVHRSGIVILDTLPAGLNRGRARKVAARPESWSGRLRMFRNRTVDGRIRVRPGS